MMKDYRGKNAKTGRLTDRNSADTRIALTKTQDQPSRYGQRSSLLQSAFQSQDGRYMTVTRVEKGGMPDGEGRKSNSINLKEFPTPRDWGAKLKARERHS